MPRNRCQAVVQLPDARHGRVADLVEQPEYTVALDSFLTRELTKRAIAAQQHPGPGFCERKSEAIRERKGRFPPPVGEGAIDAIAVQLLDAEAKPYQLLTAAALQLAFVQQVGDGEPVWQAETGLQKGPAFQIDRNGGV